MHREINHSNVQFQRIARTSRWRKMLPGALLRTSGDKKASANSSIAIFKADVNNAESLISRCKKTKLVVYVGPLQKVVETADVQWVGRSEQLPMVTKIFFRTFSFNRPLITPNPDTKRSHKVNWTWTAWLENAQSLFTSSNNSP